MQFIRLLYYLTVTRIGGCHIDGALNHMQKMFGQATDAAKGKKVIITETGWPSQGSSLKGAVSTEENAMKHFINTQDWASKDNTETFYFSSFNESWKTDDEGDVGDYWGLWDKNGKLKLKKIILLGYVRTHKKVSFYLTKR